MAIREHHDRRCSTTTSRRIPPLNNTTPRCSSSRLETIQPRSSITFHCAHQLNLAGYTITLLSSWPSFLSILDPQLFAAHPTNSFISLNPPKHITALVNKLANVKVGLVAAGKQASENVQNSDGFAEQKQAYLCCQVEKHFCFSTKVYQ